MASRRYTRTVELAVVLAAAGIGAYLLWQRETEPALVGVVRATEVRIAPEVNGQLATIGVRAGDQVRAGDAVAELSATELTAAVGQARAALDAATADRDHVYAGVRAEQVASLADEIAKAKARLDYAQQQLTRAAYLVRTDAGTQQALDQAQNAVATARADVDEAQANHDAAVAGPTKEERAIADAQVQAAAAALAVLERHLDKTHLRAPADGIVSVIVAEIGENIDAGKPILILQEASKQWLSFNVREDLLHGITVGMSADVALAGGHVSAPALVTEMTPLWGVRDVASRAGDRRPRSQHASHTSRPAQRPNRPGARHDGLDQSLDPTRTEKPRCSSKCGSSGVFPGSDVDEGSWSFGHSADKTQTVKVDD